MKRSIALVLVLLMTLHAGAALASVEFEAKSEAHELNSVDFAIKYCNMGLPRDYVWPGKLMGDPEKTGFHYIPKGHELFPWQHEFFLNNIYKLITNGELNTTTSKKPDVQFGLEALAPMWEETEIATNGENWSAFFLEKLLPHLYIMWDPNGDSNMDRLYEQKYIVGYGRTILIDNRGREEVDVFLSALNSCLSWGNDKVIWLERKSPERIAYERERVTRLLLTMNKNQMRTFMERIHEILSITARIKDKDYLIINIIKDKKLVAYMNSSEVPAN